MVLPHLPSPPNSFPFSFRLEQTFKRQQSIMIKQDTIRQCKSPPINPLGGKESQDQPKISPAPTIRIPTKHQANNYNIYTEDLVQIHACLMLAASVCVKPYNFCLIESVGHVFLMSSIPSDSWNLSPHFQEVPSPRDWIWWRPPI